LLIFYLILILTLSIWFYNCIEVYFAVESLFVAFYHNFTFSWNLLLYLSQLCYAIQEVILFSSFKCEFQDLLLTRVYCPYWFVTVKGPKNFTMLGFFSYFSLSFLNYSKLIPSCFFQIFTTSHNKKLSLITLFFRMVFEI